MWKQARSFRLFRPRHYYHVIMAAERQPLLGRRAGRTRRAPPAAPSRVVLGVSRDRAERAPRRRARRHRTRAGHRARGKHSDARTPKPTPAARRSPRADALDGADGERADRVSDRRRHAVIMYKRTHSSISALADAEFLRVASAAHHLQRASRERRRGWEGWTPGEKREVRHSRRAGGAARRDPLLRGAVTPRGGPGAISRRRWVAC